MVDMVSWVILLFRILGFQQRFRHQLMKTQFILHVVVPLQLRLLVKYQSLPSCTVLSLNLVWRFISLGNYLLNHCEIDMKQYSVVHSMIITVAQHCYCYLLVPYRMYLSLVTQSFVVHFLSFGSISFDRVRPHIMKQKVATSEVATVTCYS